MSLHDVDAAIAEADRAIKMGARGVQIFTNIAGHPLDEPRFRPFFAAMAAHDLPIWLHPARTSSMPDYAAEQKSRFEMWWCFGWPYETTIAMCRLVFDGLFDRHPKLKIITHHLGGGMIPFFDGRIGPGMEVLGSRTIDEDYSKVLSSLKRPHLDYFKEFYADTAMFGGTIWPAVRAGILRRRPRGVRDRSRRWRRSRCTSRRSTSSTSMPPPARKIMVGNAERLMNMKFA